MGYQAGVPTLLVFGLVIHTEGGKCLVQMNKQHCTLFKYKQHRPFFKYSRTKHIFYCCTARLPLKWQWSRLRRQWWEKCKYSTKKRLQTQRIIFIMSVILLLLLQQRKKYRRQDKYCHTGKKFPNWKCRFCSCRPSLTLVTSIQLFINYKQLDLSY